MSREGQFEDAQPGAALATRTDPQLAEESEESGEECWQLEYEDWQGETGDFTKKLNAVRAGNAGTNAQQGKGETGNSWNISQKAIQVRK